MKTDSDAPATIALRAVGPLLAASALGEIVVGVALAILPGAIMGFLLGGVPVEGTAAIVTRLAGIAIAALGLAWWADRGLFDKHRLRRVAGGFLVYNVGVGLLFLVYAWTADRLLLVPWVVAAAHLLVGGAFIAALTRLPPAVEPR